MTEVIKNRQSCSRSASWKGGWQVKPERRSASPLETPRNSWRAPPTIANPLILFPSPVWLPRRGAPQRWQCSLQPHRRHCAHVSANVDLRTYCRFAWLGFGWQSWGAATKATSQICDTTKWRLLEHHACRMCRLSSLDSKLQAKHAYSRFLRIAQSGGLPMLRISVTTSVPCAFTGPSEAAWRLRRPRA